jgi:HEAT repeat protein
MQPAIDVAFEALKAYDHGSSRGALLPIDDAVRACLGDDAARRNIERRLLAVVRARVAPAAKEYACNKLALIGSAVSADTLAELLSDPQIADAARNALAAISCPDAIAALRGSLARLSGRLKIGVINSLGDLRDGRSVALLTSLLQSEDRTLACAAVTALGKIGTTRAARTLLRFQPQASGVVRLATADACLACAERLLASGRRAEALMLYEALAASEPPGPARSAAERGKAAASRAR